MSAEFIEYNNELLNNIRIANQAIFTKLTPEDVAFYEVVSNTVTGSNALPFDLPAKEVFRLINKGLKFFWEWYDQGVEERTLFLPYSEIVNSKGNNLNRQVLMPNGIEAIFGWKAVECSGSYGNNISQYINYALLKNLNTGAAWSNQDFSARGAYKGDVTSIVNIVAGLYEIEQYRSLFTKGITASYNKHSQIFSIRSEIHSGLALDCLVRVRPEHLYTYQLFEDYIVALVERQLHKIIGMFDFKYPGGVQPDFNKISDDGKDAAEKIEEFLKESNDSIMMTWP